MKFSIRSTSMSLSVEKEPYTIMLSLSIYSDKTVGLVALWFEEGSIVPSKKKAYRHKMCKSVRLNVSSILRKALYEYRNEHDYLVTIDIMSESISSFFSYNRGILI